MNTILLSPSQPLTNSVTEHEANTIGVQTHSQTIAFEFHLSVKVEDEQQLQTFEDYCSTVGAKALLIELARGEHPQQPMLSMVRYYHNQAEALQEAEQEARKLQNAGFTLCRIKIEIPFSHVQRYAATMPKETKNFLPYYEWHGKVGFEQRTALLEICAAHKVHLSRNALRADTSLRFITLREYGGQELFAERVQALAAELNSKGWLIEKQQWEYCIYDNNTGLDNGWLEE